MRKRSILVFVCALFSCALLFYLKVGWDYNGNIWESFRFGSRFEMPQAERKAGFSPTYHIGWDGQFYYRVSNNPLAHGAISDQFDAPLYRYQRIFVPALAFLISRALGFELTPPILFHAIQWCFLAVGAAILFSWLSHRRSNPMFVLVWFTSGLYPLFHGVLDTTADALFIIVLWALGERRWGSLGFAATALVLTREIYVLFLLPIFAYYAWECLRDRRWSAPAVALCMALAAPILWLLYLCYHTGLRRVVAVTHLGIPLKGIMLAIGDAVERGDFREIMGRSYVAVLLASSWFWLRRVPMPVRLGAAAHLVFLLCLTSTNWWKAGQYLRFVSSLVILVIGFAPTTLFWRALLTVHLVLGIAVHAWNRDLPDLRYETAERVSDPFFEKHVLNASISSAEIDVTAPSTMGEPAPRWQRRYKAINFRLKNTGPVTWYRMNPYAGGALYFQYEWENPVSRSLGQRIALPRDVLPNADIKGTIWVRLPHKAGAYRLNVFLAQGIRRVATAESDVSVGER